MEITLKNICKTYIQNELKVEACKNIDLTIPKSTIFGIIGKSGAGKSTLVRLISLLEKPDSGEIFYDGKRVDNLSKTEIVKMHRNVGMIFQNFNLFSSRSAFKNIAYPLEICKCPKSEIKKRVTELLDLVGLSDKGSAPISTLSGGQKQRIAIARALANNPSILFCDEATSALDPQTTRSILELIRDIQKKMNLTVVMITHQMEVVRDACDFVAVLDNGTICEQGKVSEVFSNPKSEVTKDFLFHLSSNVQKQDLQKKENFLRWGSSKNADEFVLRFVGNKTQEPVISSVCKKFDVEVNILAAGIQNLSQNEKIGTLVVEISGQKEEVLKSVEYIKNLGVNVEQSTEN